MSLREERRDAKRKLHSSFKHVKNRFSKEKSNKLEEAGRRD